MRRTIFSVARCFLESWNWHQFAVSVRWSHIRLFFSYLRQTFSLINQILICHIVTGTLHRFHILYIWNLISGLNLGRYSIQNILAFIRVSKILWPSDTNHWVPIFLLKHFFLGTKNLGILFNNKIFFLVRRSWDKFMNRKFKSFFDFLIVRSAFQTLAHGVF